MVCWFYKMFKVRLQTAWYIGRYEPIY